MSDKRVLLNQISLYFVIFIGLAFTYTQVIPFLTYIGYTPIERGLILSAIAVVAIIGQFYVGYLCDKYNTIKRFYNILTILYVITNALMFAYTENSFFIHLLLVALTGGLFRIVGGLLETWTIETNEYMKNHFGTIRAFGAIGWAVGSPLTSVIINRFGYSAIGFAFAIIILISHAISYTLPDARKIEKNTNLRLIDIQVLLKNKNYIKLVVMLIFVNIIFTADMYTVIDKIIHIGGTNDEIALKWSFQAVTELPLFFMGFYLLKRFNANKLLIFSIVMFLIRFLLYTVAVTPMQIILISGMQSISFPLLLISQKVLIADESPPNLQSTGQMFALSLYVGLSALITPVLSGVLVEMFGYDLTLLMMSASLLIPLWLAISYLRTVKTA